MILDYNPSTRAFFVRIPRSDAALLVSLIKEHGLDFSTTASTADEAVCVTHEPHAAAAFAQYATPRAREPLARILAEVEASWASEAKINVKCPMNLELWPFQKADIAYALRRQNTLIGDQPGLGKTPIAICFANEIAAKRVLVLCPANIRTQWARKIREWSTLRWPYVVYPILHGRHGVHPSAEWTVVSYDLARTETIGKALAKGRYDLLILDEAHYLKTTDSRRTRAVFGGGNDPLFAALATRSERVLALTGTPLPNRPREAYTLARGLCFEAIDFLSEDAFRSRFNPSLQVPVNPEEGFGKFYIDERSGREAELQNRLRANFMTRHLKHDVLTQLKLPLFDVVLVEETGAVRQALEAESLLHIDPDADFLSGADAEILGHIAAVRRQMGVAVAPLAAEYAAMVLGGGEEKVLIAAWHIEVLNIIQEKLTKYGVIRVDGSTSPTKRQKAVDDFRTDRGKRVFLGNIQAIGIGVDGLQDVCSHAIVAEPSWVDGENQQIVDRLNRMGQKGTVLADFLVAPGSITERVLSSALKKGRTVHKVLDRR